MHPELSAESIPDSDTELTVSGTKAGRNEMRPAFFLLAQASGPETDQASVTKLSFIIAL